MCEKQKKYEMLWRKIRINVIYVIIWDQMVILFSQLEWEWEREQGKEKKIASAKKIWRNNKWDEIQNGSTLN